ncbi:hypothetical protein CGRA01v4_09604 [Colletotrichum graminicola]|nr:hypothetical protein CGRA01v4_09604 [Colletotrichum graminicola]
MRWAWPLEAMIESKRLFIYEATRDASSLSTRPGLPQIDQSRRHPLKSADMIQSESGISSRNMTCIHVASHHQHIELHFRSSLPTSRAVVCRPPCLAQTATDRIDQAG